MKHAEVGVPWMVDFEDSGFFCFSGGRKLFADAGEVVEFCIYSIGRSDCAIVQSCECSYAGDCVDECFIGRESKGEWVIGRPEGC